ncbi:ras association domain-containing protein 7-like [Clinocottus analis]|uniref:ras association domain-containing protein 7-like n=1 Tax=Clinocottus analis TaxID=304258 RepID=UPI0035C09203
MELKVWVEGVVRVVCGLSLNTSCQDVVIALAQSLGQTGRYVLLVKLRGKERQLVADDCPLQHLSQLGQLAPEVRFVLRRTGPSGRGDGEDPEPEQRGALTGPGSSARPKTTEPNRAWSPSPDARASPVPLLEPLNSAKEEAFRRILQQQRRLQELEEQLQSLEIETEAWERQSSSHRVPGPAPAAEAEPEEPDLMRRRQWEEDLQDETDRERDLHRRLNQIQSSTDERGRQVRELLRRAALLERDLRLGALGRGSRAEAPGPLGPLGPLEQELQHRRQQGEDLEAALLGTQRDLQRKEQKLQGRREMLEELNKELRQCKLQHFILQTGGPAADQMDLTGADGYLSVAALLE